MIASILHLGRSGLPKEAITNDDYERMSLCVRSLAERQPAMTKVNVATYCLSYFVLLQPHCAQYLCLSVTCVIG